MANSVRHQIMDAYIAALKGITKANGYQTNVKRVSEKLEGHEQISKSDLPALFPIDTDEKRAWVLIGATTDANLEAELTIMTTCVVYDRLNSTRQQRTDLMRDVGKAVMNDTTLGALIIDIEPMGVVTDQGTIPNYSIWDQKHLITYRYNAVDGG